MSSLCSRSMSRDIFCGIVISNVKTVLGMKGGDKNHSSYRPKVGNKILTINRTCIRSVLPLS